MRTFSDIGAKIPRLRLRLFAGILLASASIALLTLDVRLSAKQRDPVDYASSTLPMRARRTAELADAIEAISLQFLSNTILNETLDSYNSDSERYDISRWNFIFSEHLEGLAETVPELEDAIFFATRGPAKIPLTMSDSLTRSRWIPVRDDIMEGAAAADGRAVWSVLPGGAAPSTLLCARLIKRRADNRALGVLVLLIDPDRLARTVGGYSQDEGIAVTKKTDYNVLLDRNDRILASVDPAFMAMPVADAIPGYEERLKPRLKSGEAGSYKYRSTAGADKREASFWIAFVPIPDKDWTLVAVLPIPAQTLPIFVKIALFGCLLGALWFLYAAWAEARDQGKPDEGDRAPGFQPLDRMPAWYESLTPKEQVVLLFLLTGKSNKEIASLLGIREQTVKNYLGAIYRRIGVQDRFSALVLMQESGLTLESLRRYVEENPGFLPDPRILS
ncbi:LuxR C-terminal-related transcriptional regulator [bacterium]|nr:LuxR C-terminal-related transcriptional regulator [bacterium]